MVREKLNPVVMLINNDGYAVERAIHGEDQPYNDIPTVNWQLMPMAFGANENTCLMLTADTPLTLREALQSANNCRDKMVFIEIMTDKYDVPPLLAEIAKALNRVSKN